MTTLPLLDPAITYFVGVDHGAGPDASKDVLVNVEPDGKVVVIIGDVPGDTPIWSRHAILDGLARQALVDVSDPSFDAVPPLNLAAFDVPEIPKFNRAQARAAGQRGKRKK